MSDPIPARLRQQVRERANRRCEYCLIHEDDAHYPHEVDHIISRKHAGQTQEDNLAWACFEGRVTERLLQFNRAECIDYRRFLALSGRYP